MLWSRAMCEWHSCDWFMVIWITFAKSAASQHLRTSKGITCEFITQFVHSWQWLWTVNVNVVLTINVAVVVLWSCEQRKFIYKQKGFQSIRTHVKSYHANSYPSQLVPNTNSYQHFWRSQGVSLIDDTWYMIHDLMIRYIYFVMEWYLNTQTL